MNLSHEDQLRLNVLLANNVEAIRIDEQNMTVHGLAGNDEAKVELNPNCRTEQYLKQVREMLSSHVLGSPGGYPVFLQRWTRMGQAKDNQLGKLLLLGEPEAVVAVAGAGGLTDELARLAWWAMPEADIARRMLQTPAVVSGTMGKILANFLVGHLPFETEPIHIITSVRLILQKGLISDEARQKIWAKGNHRNAYHIGFLMALPHDLPEKHSARNDADLHNKILTELNAKGNDLARLLLRLLDTPGQSYLAVAEAQLRRPVNQDTVSTLFNTLGDYFRPVRFGEAPPREVNAILDHAKTLCTEGPKEILELLGAIPTLAHEIQAMLALGHCSEELIIPILAKTSASGTLLRRKLEPVTTPLLKEIGILRGQSL